MMPAIHDVVPPSTIEAEQALLGAILINPEALDRARDHVRAEDFFEDVHRHIFGVMCERRDAGEAIDWKLMKAALGDVDLGGLTAGAYLARLASEAITVVGATGYARMIADAARMRTVLETAQAAVARMTDGSVHSPADYATHMIEQLDEVASAGLAEHVRRWRNNGGQWLLGHLEEEEHAGDRRPSCGGNGDGPRRRGRRPALGLRRGRLRPELVCRKLSPKERP